jgi:hypothetical protein
VAASAAGPRCGLQRRSADYRRAIAGRERGRAISIPKPEQRPRLERSVARLFIADRPMRGLASGRFATLDGCDRAATWR